MEGSDGTASASSSPYSGGAEDGSSLFFKLSLGLSLSGMSFLGYVVPYVLKHTICFMYIRLFHGRTCRVCHVYRSYLLHSIMIHYR